MMTLEEVWENLRQDPEIKATMEEAEKSYKLFKKIENLIIADLEAKLAESEKLNKRLQQIVDKLRDKDFAGETLVNAVNAVYEPLYQNKYDEAEQIKQQLKEKDQAIESLQEINQSLGQTCNNDAKEIERLREQLAESEKVIEAYEMKEKYLKKYYNFTDEQCKMHDLLTQLWHLTYLPNKHFAEVLRSILKEVENVKNV